MLQPCQPLLRWPELDLGGLNTDTCKQRYVVNLKRYLYHSLSADTYSTARPTSSNMGGFCGAKGKFIPAALVGGRSAAIIVSQC